MIFSHVSYATKLCLLLPLNSIFNIIVIYIYILL